jgi:hypothetical protein
LTPFIITFPLILNPQSLSTNLLDFYENSLAHAELYIGLTTLLSRFGNQMKTLG